MFKIVNTVIKIRRMNMIEEPVSLIQMITEQGFKVTREGRSCIRPASAGSVPYNMNEWTIPKGGNGPLCLFRTLDSALKFVNSHFLPEDGVEIHRCIYEPSKSTSIWRHWSRSTDLRFLPLGTVLADAVMILRKEKATFEERI